MIRTVQFLEMYTLIDLAMVHALFTTSFNARRILHRWINRCIFMAASCITSSFSNTLRASTIILKLACGTTALRGHPTEHERGAHLYFGGRLIFEYLHLMHLSISTLYL